MSWKYFLENDSSSDEEEGEEEREAVGKLQLAPKKGGVDERKEGEIEGGDDDEEDREKKEEEEEEEGDDDFDEEEFVGDATEKETDVSVQNLKEYFDSLGIAVDYDHLRRLVFSTLGANAVKGKKERKDGEMRSNQIFEEEIKKKLKELRLPREAPAKSVTFKSDHKQLLQEFKNLIATKKIVWRGRRDVRTGSQDLSDQTLEKNCIAFIQTLSAGGGGSGDAISTKVLYDLESFLEKICCTKSSRDNDYLAASTLSLRLHAVRNVVNKHPDIPIGANDKNTLYRQYEALGEITAIVDRVVTGIKERRFKNNYFDFDYDDVLDAILKIYDGRLALEERRLICEFGSRSELSSIVLVHNPKEKKEGVVEDLLKDWCGVIVIESKSPIDEKKNYSDIENALPEGLKISIRKRRFIKKDTETRTIFTLAGEQDQTIARILLGIYVAETKQQSSSDVVYLLKALDKRGFDGKYSWPYRIFRLIQEFGCRDDLGTVQIVCNPTPEQMKKFDEERANLVIISTKDGKDLPKKVNFLKRYVLPAGIKVAVSLMAHKTAAENSLTPVREIESEDVIRMIIDIFLTERLYEDVNSPFFLIPRVARLVNLRKGANFKMTYIVSSVLKKLKSGDRNVKEEYKSTIFLRKLLASSEFHKCRVREFICSDGSEIEKLRDPPTIDGVLLNAHAFKMYHSLLIHIEYYLRLIFKAWKAKVDLAKHYKEARIQEIRSEWNRYIKKALLKAKEKGGETAKTQRKSYSKTEVELILDGCEGGYLGSTKPPLRELTGDARSARLLAVFESMLRQHGDEGEGAKKRDVAKEVAEKLNALEENRLAGVVREFNPVVQVMNQSIIIECFKFIVEGVNDVFEEESERAINIQKAFIRQGFTFHLADNPKAGASGSKEEVPTDFFHAFKQIAVKVWEYWMIKHKTRPKNLKLSEDEKDESVEEFLKHYVKKRDRNPGLKKEKQ